MLSHWGVHCVWGTVCAEGITAVQGGVLPTTVSRNGGQWVYCVTTDPIPLSHIVLKLQTDYWTANKHPCVALELPWTRDLTCSRSLSSRVPGPLEPLIVDCFWWASTEVRLYTGWNLSNTGHSEGWVTSTRTNTSDAASLVRVQYHTLSCIANNLIPQVSA